MQHTELVLRFGIALLIGVLIGLEREYARQEEEIKAFAGVRTFPLIALLGCSAALLADLTAGWAFAAVLLLLGLLIAVAYAIDALQGRVGVTSEVAAIVVFVCGALCLLGVPRPGCRPGRGHLWLSDPQAPVAPSGPAGLERGPVRHPQVRHHLAHRPARAAQPDLRPASLRRLQSLQDLADGRVYLGHQLPGLRADQDRRPAARHRPDRVAGRARLQHGRDPQLFAAQRGAARAWPGPLPWPSPWPGPSCLAGSSSKWPSSTGTCWRRCGCPWPPLWSPGWSSASTTTLPSAPARRATSRSPTPSSWDRPSSSAFCTP